MNFKQGGQAIQRIRQKRGLTQEQVAERAGVAPNTISRIERGALVPALPTFINICNALACGADALLAFYIAADTPIRWTPLAEKMEGIGLEDQQKIGTILDCVIAVLGKPEEE